MRRYLTAFCALFFFLSPSVFAVEGESKETAEYYKGLREVLTLADFFCNNIYPKPTPTECIDKLKHGIGQSADPHSQYLNVNEVKKFQEERTGRFGGLGIVVFKPPLGTSGLLVVNTIDGAPAQRAGLLDGDLITHITSGNSAPVPTTALKLDAAVEMLRGEPGTNVKLRVARKSVSKDIEFAITREIITIVQVEGELITYGGKTFAVIKNKTFSQNNAKEVEAKYLELKKKSGTAPLAGLILSFEGNGGGLLYEAYNNIKLFVETDKDIILMRGNDGIESYVPHPSQLLPNKPKDITRGLPILAVVNGGSASASEVVNKALKHYGRALIAGTSETFGKGVVQSIRPGSDGSAIKFTSSEYLIGSMDDWVPVQCTGVGPDVIFEFPGIKKPEALTECNLSGHVNTLGPMLNAPVHLSFKEANPHHYQMGLEMLEAYKLYRLPQLQKQEAQRKDLEKME